jgi:hypothetical protein
MPQCPSQCTVPHVVPYRLPYLRYSTHFEYQYLYHTRQGAAGAHYAIGLMLHAMISID